MALVQGEVGGQISGMIKPTSYGNTIDLTAILTPRM